MQVLTKLYTLDGTGTEISNFATTDTYQRYYVNGSAVAAGNYAISVTGTPQLGDTFVIDWEATLDITTGSKTFSILGTSLTQTQLNSKLEIVASYNGSAWKVKIVGSLDQANINGATNIVADSITATEVAAGAIGTSELATNSVTTVKVTNNNATLAKLAQIANLTVLGNISGGTANVAAISLSSIFPYVGGWSTTGNSGLTAGTNFIGTNDGVDLVFKRDSSECGRITGSGDNNTSFGLAALISYTSGAGISNTAIGGGSQVSTTTGQLNTSIGNDSLGSNTTGNHNTGLGRRTLYTVTTGSDNTAIGYNANVNSSSAINRIALGSGASATADYQFIIPTDITTVEFGQAVITTGTNIQKRLATAANATATLTATQVKVGYITSTSAAATALTLPTGALLGAALGATQGTIFKFYVDNTAGANTVTIVASVGIVLNALGVAVPASAGLLTIPSGVTGQAEFTIVFSSASVATFSRTA